MILQSMLGFLLVFSTFLCSNASDIGAAVEDSSSSSHPSFLPAKPRLRIPTSAAVRGYQKESEKNDDLVAQLETLSDEEKLNLIFTLKNTLVHIDTKLDDDLDLDEPHVEPFKPLVADGRQKTKQAIELLEQALTSLQPMARLGGSSSTTSNQSSNIGDRRRRRLHSFEEQANDYKDDDEDKARYHHHKQHYQREHKKAQHRFQHLFSAGGDDDLHSRPFTTHHSNMLDGLQQALHSGNIHAAFSHLTATHQNMSPRQHSKARRLAANQARRLTKQEQCTLLADCALDMSIYDLFVYYYSDDIEPSTGEVDDNIIKFDEDDLSGMRDKITKAAKVIKGGDQTQCDDLLSLFHRTIEKGSTPSWEGASINQVCLAEGTTVFVKFRQMVEALTGNTFPEGYTEKSTNKWIADLAKYQTMVKDKIAPEPFQCAEKLFYNRPNKEDKETFPFGGCGGKNINQCSLNKYKFPIGYDLSTEGHEIKQYVKVRNARTCDISKGYLPVMTKAECVTAGTNLKANIDTDGKLWTKDSTSRPCGCHIDYANDIIFNQEMDDCGYEEKSILICEVDKNLGRKKTISYELLPKLSKCNPEYGKFPVRSKAECKKAGKAVGGNLDSDGTLWTKDDDDRPCGCHLDHENDIIWNQEQDKCSLMDKRKLICRIEDVDNKGIGRDSHGKLRSNDGDAYLTETYDLAQSKSKACFDEALKEVNDKCEEDHKVKNSGYYECLVTKRKNALQKCDPFKSLQKGIEMVFGAQTSPGFLCGVADAVAEGANMPGRCCLDAPYELSGDLWGQPYDCKNTCQNPGPFLAGINEAACDAHGGTWCPNKANCKRLKKCVKDYIQVAEKEKNKAFKQYLLDAPKMKNPEDLKECGDARAYFGFDRFFINDNQICEDVEQLRFARDFNFLNEFFNQGSSVSPAGSKGDTPGLVLKEPDRSRSSDKWVTQETTFKRTLFAQSKVVEGMEWWIEQLDAEECPCDPFCVATITCEVVKSTLRKIFSVILKVAVQALSVLEQWMDEKIDSEDVVKAQEDTMVIFENMKRTADYLVEMRSEIKKRRLQTTSASGGLDDDGQNETISSKQDFQLKVSLRNKPDRQSIIAHTTLDGLLVGADFSLSKLNQQDQKVPVEFTKKVVETGITIMDLKTGVIDDVSELFVVASATETVHTVHDLISM